MTIALDTQERFVRVEQALPFGAYLLPGIDQKHKLQFIRVRRSWMETVDEAEFKFAIAFGIVVSERMIKSQQSVTMKLTGFVVAAPIVALIFAGDKLPPIVKTLAIPFTIVLSIGFVYVMVRQTSRDVQFEGYEKALAIGGDYEAARRHLLDERRLEGASALMKPKPKLKEQQLQYLEDAARKLGLSPKTAE